MKKLMNLAAVCMLAVTGLITLPGCAGDKYHESTGEDIDDSATTARVKDALKDDAMYKYPGVMVTTFKGTVQLSGFVDSSDEKSRATMLAKNVEGVKDVQDNISVKQ